MKLPSVLALLLGLALTASAESHPSWWTYASPDATALVGIHWDNLRNSPLAAAVEAELSSTGPLAFPDLDCLRHAREMVISSPELLAAAAGSFPSSAVKDQAPRAGLHRLSYHGVTLWIPDATSALGIAQISEQLVLIGARKTLQSAIDRSLQPSGRSYSSLLPKAARFSQTGDLWVVAIRLPDPLANLFVPLDAEGYGFLGQLSLRDGVSLEASFDASSIDAAASIAAHIKEQAQSLPAFAQALEATSDRRTVNIELQADPDEVAAALGPAAAPAPAPAPPPAPVARAAVAPPPAPATAPAAVAAAAPVTAKLAVRPPEPITPPTPQPAPEPAAAPAAVAPVPVPSGPQVVHIIGLDDGPREIVLPPLPGR